MRITALVVSAALAIAGAVVIAQDKKPSAAAKSSAAAAKAPGDADLIKNAMSAAPPAIGRDATIVTMTADGKMRTLRKGTNHFTCMPDDPSTPADDPSCSDENAMAWLDAYFAHKEPPAGKVGFVYMLQGSSDASNTDPFATKPADGKTWIKAGPHVMILGATAMMAGYPSGAAPDTTKPFVMFGGTPYAHLMIPVK